MYALIGEQIAHLAGLPASAVMPAIAELCADPEAQALVQQLPPAAPDLLERLRRHLVWITVSYVIPRKGEIRRTVQITHRPRGDEDLLALKVSQRVAWDDLTHALRSRVIQDNLHEITYQIYPPQSKGAAGNPQRPGSVWTE